MRVQDGIEPVLRHEVQERRPQPVALQEDARVGGLFTALPGKRLDETFANARIEPAVGDELPERLHLGLRTEPGQIRVERCFDLVAERPLLLDEPGDVGQLDLEEAGTEVLHRFACPMRHLVDFGVLLAAAEHVAKHPDPGARERIAAQGVQV